MSPEEIRVKRQCERKSRTTFVRMHYHTLPGMRPRAPRRNVLVLFSYLLLSAIAYWYLAMALS